MLCSSHSFGVSIPKCLRIRKSHELQNHSVQGDVAGDADSAIHIAIRAYLPLVTRSGPAAEALHAGDADFGIGLAAWATHRMNWF